MSTESTWRSNQTRPQIDGYYEVESVSGRGERVWMHNRWWAQDYRLSWMPEKWTKGHLKWRGPKRHTSPVITPPYIPKP